MITALYVDDEPSLLEVTKLFLEMDGAISMDTCEDPRRALGLIEDGGYDVIVSDYQMPEMDGLELLQEVRGKGCQTPFIIFTGRGREEVAVQALNLGADFYMQKGGDPNVQFGELSNAIFKLAQKRSAEKALQESEALFRLIAENARDIVYRYQVDPVPRFEYISPSVSRITGYTPEEHYSNPDLFTEIVHPDDLSKFERVMRDPELLKKPLLLRWKTKNGRTVWAEQQSVPIFDDQGNLAAVQGVVRDVTERVMAETALREREERLRLITDNMMDIITVIDLEGTITFTSPSVRSVMGYEPSSRLGVNAFDQVHPEDADKVRAMFHDALIRQDSSKVEFRYRRQDGTYIWLETVGSVLRDSEGIPTGVVLTSRDITERRRAEQERASSERKFRDVFDNATDCIFIVDHKGQFVEVNRVACQRLGYDRDELVGMALTEVGRASGSRKLWPDGPDTNKGKSLYESTLTTRDGVEFPVEVSSTSISFQGLPATLCLVRDIAERKETELRLKESEALLLQTQATAHIGGYHIDFVKGRSEWTDEAFRICGMDPSTLGVPREECLHLVLPEDRELVNQAWREDQDVGKDLDFVYRLLAPDGSIKFIRNRGRLEIDANGDVVGIIGTIMDITDLREAEQRLAEGRELLAEAQKLSRTGSFRVDLATGAVQWSEEMFNITGWDRSAGPPSVEEYWIIVHPEDREELSKRYQGAIEQASSYDVSYRLATVNGIKHVQTKGRIVTDGRGRAVGVFGTLADITDRHRLEAERERMERRFRDVFDNASDAIFIFGPKGNFLEINKVACERLGYRREEMLAMNMSFILAPSRATRMKEVVQQIIDQGEMIFESAHITRSGEVIPVEVSAKAIDYGGFDAILSIARDLSERRRAERELRESQELLAEAERTSHVGSYHVDWVQGTSRWSEEAVRIIGMVPLGKETSPAETFLRSVHPQDHDRLCQAWDRATIVGGEFEIEYRVLTPDGDIRWVLNKARIEKDAFGSPCGFFGTVMDITELKHAQEALELAKFKLTLLGDMTRHDVQNKLTALSGYLQLAEHRTDDPACLEYLGKARVAMQSISHQMSFSKEYQTLGLNEARWIPLQEACAQGTGSLDLGRLQLITRLEGAEVLADPMLEKVFHNLVENTVKYGKSATMMSITVSETPLGLLILFEDNGVGISAEDKRDLFELQLRDRRGHGLHLIREVLRLSGISIKETGTPGKGARFEVLVPQGRYRLPVSGRDEGVEGVGAHG